jgi:hypothetical protein
MEGLAKIITDFFNGHRRINVRSGPNDRNARLSAGSPG